MKHLKDFSTKKEYIKYLCQNKAEIIAMKKAAIKYSDPSSCSQVTAKALQTNYHDDVSSGVIKRLIVGNTYNWMDSHGDVHLDNVFEKSIKDKGVSKIWHLHDHEHKITAKVGTPENIDERSVSWKDLGVDIPGNTMALFMESNIKRSMNPLVFGMYLGKEIDQHSVGMRYIKMDFAANDQDDEEAYANYQKYLPMIGNREDAEKQGYFWIIKEAALIEISAVLAGSNELTPTVDNESKELLTYADVEKAALKMSGNEAKMLYEKIGKRMIELEKEVQGSGIDYDYLVKNFGRVVKGS